MTELMNLQKEVQNYDIKYNWDKDRASHIVLHLNEELGEISRRILRKEGYKKEPFNKEELAQELTDVLYLTLKLANTFQIDMDSEWEKMWPRYEQKTNRL